MAAKRKATAMMLHKVNFIVVWKYEKNEIENSQCDDEKNNNIFHVI